MQLCLARAARGQADERGELRAARRSSCSRGRVPPQRPGTEGEHKGTGTDLRMAGGLQAARQGRGREGGVSELGGGTGEDARGAGRTLAGGAVGRRVLNSARAKGAGRSVRREHAPCQRRGRGPYRYGMAWGAGAGAGCSFGAGRAWPSPAPARHPTPRLGSERRKRLVPPGSRWVCRPARPTPTLLLRPYTVPSPCVSSLFPRRAGLRGQLGARARRWANRRAPRARPTSSLSPFRPSENPPGLTASPSLLHASQSHPSQCVSA